MVQVAPEVASQGLYKYLGSPRIGCQLHGRYLMIKRALLLDLHDGLGEVVTPAISKVYESCQTQ